MSEQAPELAKETQGKFLTENNLIGVLNEAWGVRQPMLFHQSSGPWSSVSDRSASGSVKQRPGTGRSCGLTERFWLWKVEQFVTSASLLVTSALLVVTKNY